jgi:integrase
MSRSIRATIHNIMSWHEEGDDDYRSPLANVSRRPRKNKQREVTARDRTLTDDEIKAVWNAASECGMFGALVKMLLLTAQRRDKVATMKWTDINEGVWTIATEAGEKGNAGSLRLPHAALDILAEQPKIAGNPFVFAGRHGKATNAFSQGVEGIRKLLPQNMERWTLHDLRRTARTLMSDAGVRPDIAERVLGHAIPGVGGVYDRSGYFEQKAEALKALANKIESII